MLCEPTLEMVVDWSGEVEVVRERLEPHFARAETQHRLGLYLRGLLAGVDRKNGWQLAEYAGDLSPANMQHFIGRARWDADSVRDDLRSYVVEALGEPEGVLIVDETGFLKKGEKSVGVQRQYSGTAGRIENCQIGVFLAYKSSQGHALIDRALYLPESWAGDEARRKEAHVPEEVAFATKPKLARRMVEEALDAGVPAAWVAADEVYGCDSGLRHMLEDRGVGYVVTVACSQQLFLNGKHDRVDAHAASFPQSDWTRQSCGPGCKGDRLYDWAFVPFPARTEKGMQLGLLVRRSTSDPKDRAYYLVHGPVEATVADFARVAGSRWAVEECFELAKGECGLDHGEGRTWHSWYRHITIVMFALAVLAALRTRIATSATPNAAPPPSSAAPVAPSAGSAPSGDAPAPSSDSPAPPSHAPVASSDAPALPSDPPPLASPPGTSGSSDSPALPSHAPAKPKAADVALKKKRST